jgi:hypothetical protein
MASGKKQSKHKSGAKPKQESQMNNMKSKNINIKR